MSRTIARCPNCRKVTTRDIDGVYLQDAAANGLTPSDSQLCRAHARMNRWINSAVREHVHAQESDEYQMGCSSCGYDTVTVRWRWNEFTNPYGVEIGGEATHDYDVSDYEAHVGGGERLYVTLPYDYARERLLRAAVELDSDEDDARRRIIVDPTDGESPASAGDIATREAWTDAAHRFANSAALAWFTCQGCGEEYDGELT